jgi:hypothetical protein
MALLLVFALAGVAFAGSSPRFDVYWQVLSGGGAPAEAGGVSLNGSLGQAVIGQSTSARFDLDAGYWRQGSHMIYLPLVVK